MYPLGIVASGDPTAVRDRVVAALSEHGRVALLTAGQGGTSTDPGVRTEYAVGEGGDWRGVGGGVGPEAALDRLAPTHEYVVVTGHPALDIPHIVVGDPEYDGEELLAAADPDGVDTETVRERLEETRPHETLSSLIEQATDTPGADRAGAVATFTGRVRERDGPDDPETTHLEFETYEDVARERMATLESELESREGVVSVCTHHRTGVIESGEDIVFVVVLAGHREEAFETVSDGIDRLKAEVPIFKKEVTVNDEFWLHER